MTTATSTTRTCLQFWHRVSGWKKSVRPCRRCRGFAGLHMADSVAEEESSAENSGRITQQNPAAGSQLSRGSRVTVTVGTGPRMVRVPSNLVGQDIENVRSTLDAMGFDVEVENVDSTA